MQLYSSPPQRNAAPVVIPQDVPVYRIAGGGFYCDDELHPAGTIMAYDDEPNQDMEPLNKLAVDGMRKFLTKLDDLGRKKSEKDNTAFISALDAFDAMYNQNNTGSKRARALNGKEETQILGSRKKSEPKAKRLEVSAPAEFEIVDKTNESGRDKANATTDTGLGGKTNKLFNS
jgi:hypothetical protein